MNDKEFFDRTIPAMLEKYPAPDKNTIIRFIEKGSENMNENKENRRTWASKKAIIIPVIIAAITALTGAVIHRIYTVGYEMSDLISEFKVGRYYLETTDGYDPDCYIEIFDGNKIQFFGTEQKDSFDNGNYYDWNSAPVEYKILDKIPFIAINDAWNTLYDDNGGSHLGILYTDENTLCIGVNAEEFPDAKDYSRDVDKEENEKHGIVFGHFVFRQQSSDN